MCNQNWLTIFSSILNILILLIFCTICVLPLTRNTVNIGLLYSIWKDGLQYKKYDILIHEKAIALAKYHDLL